MGFDHPCHSAWSSNRILRFSQCEACSLDSFSHTSLPKCSWPAEFDLTELRSALDSQGLAIAERQETSVTSRRKLAETTKGQLH